MHTRIVGICNKFQHFLLLFTKSPALRFIRNAGLFKYKTLFILINRDRNKLGGIKATQKFKFESYVTKATDFVNKITYHKERN